MEKMLLIYEDESGRDNVTGAQIKEVMGAYQAYSQDLVDAGFMRAGAGLERTSSATTVRMRGGAPDTTDGPFDTTSLQLTGYYLVDCPDLDAALKAAAKCPGALHGAVEVRPVMAM